MTETMERIRALAVEEAKLRRALEYSGLAWIANLSEAKLARAAADRAENQARLMRVQRELSIAQSKFAEGKD